MRKAIDTAPRNGDSVILEDAARGTIAVACWSVETAQWLDEHGAPIQLNATHWHSPKSLEGEGSPSQLNATYWQSLTPAQSVGETAEKSGSLAGLGKLSAKHVHRGASRPVPVGMTAQPQRAARPGRSVSAGARGAVGWIVRRPRSIATMAACLLVGAALVPFLHHGEYVEWFVHRTSSEGDTELKQALRQEQERADKLAKELAEAQRDSATQTALTRTTIDDAARAETERERVIGELREALQTKQVNVRAVEQLALKQEQDKTEKLRVELSTALREGESRAAMLRSASDEATRMKQASARAMDELRQALEQAQAKAEKLAGELAMVRREVKAQMALVQTAHDDARRAADRSSRSAEEQNQALREAQGNAEKLATELAEARREIQSQEAAASSAKAEAEGVKEAAKRSADEHRRALQQERDRTDRLATELAETKSSLETEAKATAAEGARRDNQVVMLRQELQKAKAEATAARESFEAERLLRQWVEQQATSIQEGTGDRGIRSSAPVAPPIVQPSAAVPSVPQAQTKAPAGAAAELANLATRAEANIEQGGPHAIRLAARANLLLDQGNIGAARNMLDRAAEMGSAAALFWLAETYDPLVLSARQTFGTQSDVAKARELYRKALVGGVSEAKIRLEALQRIGGNQ